MQGNYGAEADLWSAGVILYILLCGLPPFYGRTEKEIFAAVRRGRPEYESSAWQTVSAEAKDLVQRYAQELLVVWVAGCLGLQGTGRLKKGDLPRTYAHRAHTVLAAVPCLTTVTPVMRSMVAALVLSQPAQPLQTSISCGFLARAHMLKHGARRRQSCHAISYESSRVSCGLIQGGCPTTVQHVSRAI